MKESSFQFSEPQLIDIEFHTNENFDKDLFEGFSIESKVSTCTIETGNEAIVSLKIMIGDESEKYPFHIWLIMSARFTCNENDSFQKLLKINAPALLLSYARPIISLITSQAGYSSFNLPFMNFTED